MSGAYQIDFHADAAGKRIPSSKRRVLFRFGFCSGSEHVVSLSWSPTSGKTILAADGREVHFSPGKGFISMQGKFQTSWEMEEGNHILRIMAYAAPPIKNRSGFRRFDLFLDGRSFFDLPKMSEVHVHEEDERRGPRDDVTNEREREKDVDSTRTGLADDFFIDPQLEEDRVPAVETREERAAHRSFEGVYRRMKNGSISGTKLFSSPLAIVKRKPEAVGRSKKQLRQRGITPTGYPPLETTRPPQRCDDIRTESDDTFQTNLDIQRQLLEAEVRDMENRLQNESEAAQEKICLLQGKISEQEVEKTKVDQALAVSEGGAQALRAEAAEHQEEIQKLKLDGASTREEITRLKGQVSQFEAIVRKNEALRCRNEEIRDSASLEQRKSGLALAAYKVEVEKLGRSAGVAEEEARRLKCDKIAAENEIRQLKSRITSLEKELADNTRKSLPMKKSVTAPKLNHVPECSKIATSANDSNKLAHGTRGGETGSYLANSKKCCLCCKDPGGTMQTCQCGRKSCGKHAHASCLIGSGRSPLPSVSHPCTPAPVLPLILCGGIFDK